MAVLALHLFSKVAAFQLETGFSVVIEFLRVERNDFCISSFVLGMAFLAGLLVFHLAMETMHVGYILGDLLMAILAKSGLGAFIELFMALCTFLVVLFMPLDQITGRQYVRE